MEDRVEWRGRRCVTVVVTGRWQQQQLWAGSTGGPLSIRHYINTVPGTSLTLSMMDCLGYPGYVGGVVVAGERARQ